MTDAKKFYSQTTLGFVEQQNAGETDRRFAYFQHNSTIFKNLNLLLVFSSFSCYSIPVFFLYVSDFQELFFEWVN